MLVKLTGSMCAHWLEGVDRPFSAIGLKYVLHKVNIVPEGILDRAEQQLRDRRHKAVLGLAKQAQWTACCCQEAVLGEAMGHSRA